MENDPFAFLDEPLPPTDARTLIPDYILDELPDGASEGQAAQEYAYHLIWRMQQPKTLKTVRRHMLASNAFMMRLAEINPEVFDEVLCAYAERAMKFDAPDKETLAQSELC